MPHAQQRAHARICPFFRAHMKIGCSSQWMRACAHMYFHARACWCARSIRLRGKGWGKERLGEWLLWYINLCSNTRRVRPCSLLQETHLPPIPDRLTRDALFLQLHSSNVMHPPSMDRMLIFSLIHCEKLTHLYLPPLLNRITNDTLLLYCISRNIIFTSPTLTTPSPPIYSRWQLNPPPPPAHTHIHSRWKGVGDNEVVSWPGRIWYRLQRWWRRSSCRTRRSWANQPAAPPSSRGATTKNKKPIWQLFLTSVSTQWHMSIKI